MVQISHLCPHCLTERAAFTSDIAKLIKPQSTEFIALFQCGVCGNGIVAKLVGVHVPAWYSGQANININNRGGTAYLDDTWPKPTPAKSPEHVNAVISGYYVQAMDNMSRRNFDAAGIMFRKTLEASLKDIDPSGKGNLYNRIINLPRDKGITDALKDCAHAVRQLGADAAHEDDPFSELDVKSIQSFTELFLTYAFTLPGMLAARKAAITASATT